MKKRFTRILAAFALLVFMMPSMVAWGQTRTTVTDVMNQSWTGVTGSSYTDFSNKAGSASNAVYAGNCAGGNSSIQLRSKNSNSGIVSTTSGGTVTKVTVTWNSNTQSGRTLNVYGSNTAYTAASDLYNSNNQGTLLGTIVCGTSTELTVSGSFAYIGMRSNADAMYLTTINVEWETGGTTPTVAAPTFSPANGTTFEETLQVTLSQADNKDIYYNINSESDPNANSTPYTGPFFISATSTIKAIAIDGENTSSVATATYTKLVYNNIEDIVANQTQYTVKGTVVATNNRGFVIGDGTGYVYTYLNELPSQAIGDKVRISGSTGSYGHVLQFTSSATITTSTTSNYDGTPAIVTVDETAMAGYNSDYQLSDYVQYEGTLTKSTSNNNTYYNIAVGSATARISYQTTAQANQLEALLNKTVKVKGYFAGFSSSIFTTMMESVEEVVSTEPVLSVNPTSLSFTYTQGATEVPSESFSITGSNLTDDVTVTLPSNYAMYDAETGDPISSTYTLTPEDGVINTTLVVELNSGLQQGSYNGSITIAWEGEEDLTVALTGTVTEPEPENVTWDLSTNSYASASEQQVTWTSDYATMRVDKANATTNANNYLGGNGNYTSTRFYKNSELTVTPATGYAISSVVFTATTNGYANALKGSTWTNATATMETGNDVKIVTVTPTDGATAISAVIGATCGFTAVTVYYEQNTTPSIAVALPTANVPAQPEGGMYEGTLAINYANLTISNNEDFGIQFYDENGNELNSEDQPNWIIVVTASDIIEGETVYLVSYVVEANDGEARTAYFKVFATGDTDFVYSNLVTVTQAKYVVDYATLPFTFTGGRNDIANVVGLTEDGLGSDYGGNVSTKLKFDDTDDNLILKLNEAPTSLSYDIKGNSFSGGMFKVMVSANGSDYETLATYTELGDTQTVTHIDLASTVRYIKWVYTEKSSGNVGLGNIKASANYDIYGTVRVANLAPTDNKKCTIYEGGALIVTGTMTNTSTANFIIEDGGQYTGNSVAATMKKLIDACTYSSDNNTGYTLIASPMNGLVYNNTAQTNLTANSYDLYEYVANPSDDKEWHNFKETANNLSTLNSGQGYLYANNTSFDLLFMGNTNTTFSNVQLPYVEGDLYKSLYLAGNTLPHAETFYVVKDANSESQTVNFLTINNEGSGFTTTSASSLAVQPMQGFFVQATSEALTLTTQEPQQAPAGDALLNIMVSRNRGAVIDNAIVSFGNAPMMNKFRLTDNATELFVPMGSKDMTVVNAQAEGEMPVSFKAAENGTYTLSIETENVEMSYLHLIDNMTGADVDLLATPNYTFEAKTTDYANRFRLVFSASSISEDADGDNAFAYYNGSSWTVSNMGEATLQVVDVMGRVLSSETLSGNAEVSINQTPGVYMLRLVSGDSVKVQKVVVR